MQVHDVDLKLLRIFVAIAESGGLSAAESRLNIGRSTISSHLADLEVRLGVKLCNRGRGGFELTESGRVTYQASLELLQQCQAFTATIANAKNKLSGRVTIATIDNLISDPRNPVAKAIAALNEKSEQLQFEVNICQALEVETAVINGRSLIGIGVSRHPIRGLRYHPLYNETNYLYCSNEHLLFNAKQTEQAVILQNAQMVTSNYSRDKETRNDGLNYQNNAVAYHDEGIAHLILSGKFIGYLPEHYAQYWVDKGLFKAISPDKYGYDIQVNLITANNKASSPLAQALIKEIKRYH